MAGFIFRLKQTLSIINTSNRPNITYYTLPLKNVLQRQNKVTQRSQAPAQEYLSGTVSLLLTLLEL